MESLFKRLKEVYARTYSLDPESDADFFDCVKDIYFSREVQSLKKYPQHDKMDRLQHITSVAYLTFRVCRHFGLDYRRGRLEPRLCTTFSTTIGTRTIGATVRTATGIRGSPPKTQNYCAAVLIRKAK